MPLIGIKSTEEPTMANQASAQEALEALSRQVRMDVEALIMRGRNTITTQEMHALIQIRIREAIKQYC